MATQHAPPVIGEIWPGEGGIYVSTIAARDDQPAYHLILAETDVGRFYWGPFDDKTLAVSLHDGPSNTSALLTAARDNPVLNYPAAQAAISYTADGHQDFYLPAIAELQAAWLSLGDKDWGWIWSSSQRSEDVAYRQLFAQGVQYPDSFGKNGELRVYPVRRVVAE